MTNSKFNLGPQYIKDDPFKKVAREHQSNYRANELQVDFNEYGNRLQDDDARKHLNYYSKLGVIQVKNERYPNYSKTRDADLLRSEHIPFNIFGPLKGNLALATEIFKTFSNLKIKEVRRIELEYAPQDKTNYLNDATSFDAYVEFINDDGKKCGLGIEVKYTEQAYKLTQGSPEYVKVNSDKSIYHIVTNDSGKFETGAISEMKKDDYRQVWRNYILGLSMINKDVELFYSMTLYPSGNKHMEKILTEFPQFIKTPFKNDVFGVTFESFFQTINQSIEKTQSNKEYAEWVNYLEKRYIVK